jgi:hypothetical protein
MAIATGQEIPGRCLFVSAVRLSCGTAGRYSRPVARARLCLFERGERMPKFVIEREVPGASKLTEAELQEISLKSLEVLRQLGPDIQWMQSYITEDKIYCIFFASDDGLIFEHARRGGFAANRVSAVRRMLDPANYE